MKKLIDFIIVTYNPDIYVLERSINSIKNQVRYVIIIDNNSESNIIKFLKDIFGETEKFKFVKLEENMGIAYALNIGINISIKNNSDYILISDQDTIYPKNYINEMLKLFYLYKHKKIAAIAPLFKDTNKKRKNEGFYKKTLFGYKKFYPENGIFEIFQTISSGMIINSKFIKDIGLFNEELFIDWVDFEWCWRADKKGYKILGNANIIITHTLGKDKKDLKFKEINLRNPYRHYYIVRNAFYLALHSKSINFILKSFIFLSSFKYILGFPVFSKPHLKNFLYVSKGLFDGIRGKLGKII